MGLTNSANPPEKDSTMSPPPLISFIALALAMYCSTRVEAAATTMYTVTNLGPGAVPMQINDKGSILMGTAPSATGQTYSVVQGSGPDSGRVSLLGPAASATINNSGQVVASAEPGGQSFVAQPDPLNGSVSYHVTVVTDRTPTGINDEGQVVGKLASGDGYLQSGGKTVNLGSLAPRFINDAGQIGGILPNGQGFLSTHGQVTAFGPVGYQGAEVYGTSYPRTEPSTMNAVGQVVGGFQTSDSNHGFLFSGGKFTDLGTLPGTNISYANSINDSGSIVGASYTISEPVHSIAFLDTNGVMKDLNALIAPGFGMTLVQALSINVAGQIVGTAQDLAGNEYGYLLTPIGQALPAPPSTPEPASVAFFGVIAAGLGVRMIRRQRAV